MYEKIQDNHRNYRGKWLYILLVCCVSFCVVTVSLVARILIQSQHFKQYIGDFSNSTSYAYSQGYVTAIMEDRQRHVTGERIYSLYNLIVNCRGIKEQDRPQSQPEIILDFGDRSKMEFWVSELENATNNRKYGLLICYQNKDGDVYCYDTDRLDIERVKLLLKDKIDYVNTAPAQ